MQTSPAKQEQQRTGKKRRKEVARSDHAQWDRHKRKRSSLELLDQAEKGRLPHLLALKHERMAVSPFGYFRGAVPVMAYDLSLQPQSGVVNQLCGDAHVRNLGAYAGPDGRPVFDINDFDETVRGPFEWDVKRLATSIHLTAREANESEADCCHAVRVFLRRYRKSIHCFAAMPVLEIARFQIHRATSLATVSAVFAEAERSTPLHLRDTLTQVVPGQGSKKKQEKRSPQRLFCSNPPLTERLSPKEAACVLGSMSAYLQTIQPERRHLLSRYRPLDVAFKVVGTGSVGLRAYCIYFEGNGPADPLFLQVKQEVASAWAAYLPAEAVPEYAQQCQGRRVVEGQRAMQVQSDPFLGYTSMDGHDFLVRQLNDHKGSVNLGTIDAAALGHYADLCGELLARGHARSGDPDALAGYIGHGTAFDKAIADFARRYADQTERDWQALRDSHRA